MELLLDDLLVDLSNEFMGTYFKAKFNLVLAEVSLFLGLHLSLSEVINHVWFSINYQPFVLHNISISIIVNIVTKEILCFGQNPLNEGFHFLIVFRLLAELEVSLLDSFHLSQNQGLKPVLGIPLANALDWVNPQKSICQGEEHNRGQLRILNFLKI